MKPVYKLITPPDYANTLPISLASAKRQLNVAVEFTGDDQIITDCVKAAAAFVENIIQGPVLTQVWELQLPSFYASPLKNEEGTGILIYKNPVTALSVNYYNTAGADTPLNASNYFADMGSAPARIVFNSGLTLPAVATRPDAVRVTITCGYANEAALPPDMAQWLKVIITRFYSYRDYSIDPKFEQAVMDGLKPHMLWL